MTTTFPFPDHPGVEPAPQYAPLRDRDPLVPVILRNGAPALLVHRHEDVRQALTSSALSRSAAADIGLTSRSKESLSLNAVDPPDHTRRRRLITSAFTARRVAGLLPDLEERAERLLSQMIGAGSTTELMSCYAVPLTVMMISRILGVPENDDTLFRPWTDAMMSTTAYPRPAVRAAHEAMHRYFLELLDKADPGGASLIGETAGHVGTGALGRDEAAHLLAGLLMAGYETTSNQLGMCVVILTQRPDIAGRLRHTPGDLPRAVDEMLRWSSLTSTGGVPHVAQRDVTIGGTPVRAGQVLLPLTDAANHDPAAFDQPDLLDIDRADNPHLSFGHGRHRCPGAPLAMAELTVALRTLICRLPGLRLAVPLEQLVWRTGMYIRGPRRLPVSW
jgi:cytochrome P450